MTSAPFTEAARAEATSRARRVPPGDTAADWSERMLMMEQFRQGAEWARTHLAAQEPTGAEVLAALNAQGVVVSPKMHPAPSLDYWGDKPVEAMRAALSAARAARREPCAECGHTDQHKFSCSHREGHGATIPARRDEEKR